MLPSRYISRYRIVFLVFLAYTAACKHTTPPPSPDGGGAGGGDPLVIALRAERPAAGSPAEGATAFSGTITKVSVHRKANFGPGTWEVVVTTSFPFVMNMPDIRLPVPVSVLDLAPGLVDEIDFTVADLTLSLVTGATKTVVVPGNVLRIMPTSPLTITATGETAVLVPLRFGMETRCLGNAYGDVTDAMNHLTMSHLALSGCSDSKHKACSPTDRIALSPVLRGLPAQPVDVLGSIKGDAINVFVTTPGAAAGVKAAIVPFDPATKFDGEAFAVKVPDRTLISTMRTKLLATPGVASVTTNFQSFLRAVPDDSKSYSQFFESAAYQAQTITTGSTTTTVTVIDSGVDLTQADLIPNIWINVGELPTAMQPTAPCTGADVDCDGLVTFRDFNAMSPELLSSFGLGVGAGNPTLVDPYDLIPVVANGMDDDADGYNDDVVGWNYVAGTPYPDPMSTADRVSNGFNPQQHGLAVAGIIGAVANNTFGVPGVSPTVRIMAMRVCGDQGKCDETSTQLALMLAARKGIDVANLSLGAIIYNGQGASDAGIVNDAACGAVAINDIDTYKASKASEETFYSRSALANMLIVRAAADCDAFFTHAMRFEVHEIGMDVPGATNLIGVTGLGEIFDFLQDRTRQSTVRFRGGVGIDIAASGSNFHVLGHGTDGRSTGNGPSGTSFSTPLVVGTAALVLAADPSLRGNPAGIKARVLLNADKKVISDDMFHHSGLDLVLDGNRLNACQAVANGLCPVPYGSPAPPNSRDGGIAVDSGVQDACAGVVCPPNTFPVPQLDGTCLCVDVPP